MKMLLSFATVLRGYFGNRPGSANTPESVDEKIQDLVDSALGQDVHKLDAQPSCGIINTLDGNFYIR